LTWAIAEVEASTIAGAAWRHSAALVMPFSPIEHYESA